MMLAFDLLNDTVDLDGDFVAHLIIENKKIFRQTMRSFYDDTVDEIITFSDNFTPFEFSKKGYFIPNMLDLDFQNKKLMNKINSVMQQTALNECDEELTSIRRDIISLFDKLNQMFDFEYDAQFDVDYSAILKLLDFKIDTSSRSCAELLVSYILLLNKYLKFDLFVLHNVYAYFDNEETEFIFKTLKLNHINLLCLSSSKPEKYSCFERVYILDNDLCSIDNKD